MNEIVRSCEVGIASATTIATRVVAAALAILRILTLPFAHDPRARVNPRSVSRGRGHVVSGASSTRPVRAIDRRNARSRT